MCVFCLNGGSVVGVDSFYVYTKFYCVVFANFIIFAAFAFALTSFDLF